MFLIIPLSIFLLSVGALTWLMARKFAYLKKLSPATLAETLSGEEGFWQELFPEFATWWRAINPRAYGVGLLNESEKALRKFRLLSLKVDAVTNRLIHRVRKSSQKHGEILVRETAKQAEEERAAAEDDLDYSDLGNTPEELKQKEQLLIIEIAKHPKDAFLYKELGVAYMRLEEWSDARQSFETALELDPGDEAIKRKLGRVLAKLNTGNSER